MARDVILYLSRSAKNGSNHKNKAGGCRWLAPGGFHPTPGGANGAGSLFQFTTMTAATWEGPFVSNFSFNTFKRKSFNMTLSQTSPIWMFPELLELCLLILFWCFYLRPSVTEEQFNQTCIFWLNSSHMALEDFVKSTLLKRRHYLSAQRPCTRSPAHARSDEPADGYCLWKAAHKVFPLYSHDSPYLLYSKWGV